MNINQVLSWKGEVNRKDYLIWGVLLLAVKYNLDRLVASYLGKNWFIIDYFRQVDSLAINNLSSVDQQFYLTIVAISIPFIWFGTVLSLKRLRNAQIPSWLVVLFFLPFVNFILFVSLAALPERKPYKEQIATPFLDRLIPTSKYGSALFAVGIVVLVTLALTAFFVNVLGQYGWSLFVGIPFFLGFSAVLIYGYHQPVNAKQAIGVVLLAVFIFCGIIFILAFEGIICIIMGLPILLVVGMIGGAIGYTILQSKHKISLNVFCWPILIIFGFGILESKVQEYPPLAEVRTSISIDRDAQSTWDHLVSFGTIAEPTYWLFETGIAYPIHAEISGQGVGAVRTCHFTTGSFVEPITIWDEPNLLEFSVLDQPAPMVEWSFYPDLEIVHLDGYFKSERGQFKLTPLPEGKTLLEGTTWYQHQIWPSFYWRIWSDFILQRIHLRVLQHIKKETERHIDAQ